MTGSGAATLTELRILDGPNLFFARPAVQLTLERALVSGIARRTARSLRRRCGPPRRVGRPAEPRPPELRPPGTLRRAAGGPPDPAPGRIDQDEPGGAGEARAGARPDHARVPVAAAKPRRGVRPGGGRAARGRPAVEANRERPADRGGRASVRRGARRPAGSSNPSIPVIAVTGTNGKTTTVRLLSHLARTAGLHVAYSSTDGVYFDDALVEEGDYSGFAGAGSALSQPGAQLAVLETARGGILLRGVGTSHNDVALVTNISADHLGLRGIRTLDQLAEVKSTILKITRPDGWDVLNADDPRVLAMRRVARGRPWIFSLDPNHPALRSAMEEHGRGMTVIDGRMAVLTPGRDARPLVSLEEIPVTIAGLSTHNVQNAMGAAAAALGAGIDEPDVVRGLTTFVLDPDRNPGRTNLFEVDGRVIVVDYAHNEAGMRGLAQVCRGLCRPGGSVWPAFGSAGDRTNEILHGLALSLHAPEGDALRSRLMPVNDRYPLAEVLGPVPPALRAAAPQGLRRVRDAGRASNYPGRAGGGAQWWSCSTGARSR